MSLRAEQIRTIAELARLALDEAETARYARELSSVFELVAQLESAGVEGVEPLAHPLEMPQRLREDRPEAADPVRRERLQDGAPAVADGLFLVPRVVE